MSYVGLYIIKSYFEKKAICYAYINMCKMIKLFLCFSAESNNNLTVLEVENNIVLNSHFLTG